MWTYSWDFDLFPDCLRRYYEEDEHREILIKHMSKSSMQAIFHRDLAVKALDADDSNIRDSNNNPDSGNVSPEKANEGENLNKTVNNGVAHFGIQLDDGESLV